MHIFGNAPELASFHL